MHPRVMAGPEAVLINDRAGRVLLQLPVDSILIVPLNSANGMALHYFPKLGGEFFLLEGDIAEYTQVHAAPALDFMRLEIESKKERDYQWIVHHLDRPRRIGAGAVELAEVEVEDKLRPGAWFYDAPNKNLHVRIVGRAGGDEIINIAF